MISLQLKSPSILPGIIYQKTVVDITSSFVESIFKRAVLCGAVYDHFSTEGPLISAGIL